MKRPLKYLIFRAAFIALELNAAKMAFVHLRLSGISISWFAVLKQAVFFSNLKKIGNSISSITIKTKIQMKKRIFTVVILATTLTLGSCGTVCGGKISDCQKTKPAPGEPKRKVRPAALIFDLIGPLPGISLIIDLCTGGLYKPCNK